MIQVNDIFYENEALYEAILDDNIKVKGHRYFDSSGVFKGLYDKKSKLRWKVKATTLRRIK